MNCIRREMEVCPNCGALEPSSTYSTKRDAFGNIVRYRRCRHCKMQLPTLILLRPHRKNDDSYQ